MSERDEQKIEIKEIYIYPVNGLKGIKVDSCEMTIHGLLGDRNWCILSEKLTKLVPMVDNKVSFLR